jgi:hypothetical protein
LAPYIIALSIFVAAAGLFRTIATMVGHLDRAPTLKREEH